MSKENSGESGVMGNHVTFMQVLREDKDRVANQGNVKIYTSFFFFFLWPHPWHREIPRSGIESELQLQPMPQPRQCQIRAASVTYSEATAMLDS